MAILCWVAFHKSIKMGTSADAEVEMEIKGHLRSTKNK